MDKDGNQWSLTHNLYAGGMNFTDIENEFAKNHQYLSHRKNGNALFHEIISLEQGVPLSEKAQVKILEDLAKKYIERRAPNNLVYGRIHNDQAHLHLHLLISSNTIKSAKRLRLTKAEFAHIQQELEAYKIKTYPELGEKQIYGKRSKRQKTSNNEYALTKRTGVLSQKQEAKRCIEAVFRVSTSFESLEGALKQKGFSLYQRGSVWGVSVLASQYRFRLKTLGLMDEFALILTQYETQEDRQKELSALRASKYQEQSRE